MATPATTTRFFIDESGTPDKYAATIHLSHDKFFTIAAVTIRQPDYLIFKSEMNTLCKKYRKYLIDKEIKSSYIRYSNPSNISSTIPPEYEFHKYPEGQEQYLSFNSELKALLEKTNFRVLSVTTNKYLAGIMYPRTNLHYTLMSDLWERIAISIVLNECTRVKIVFDPTKGNADKVVFESYTKFKTRGSSFISDSILKKLNLSKYIFPVDSEASRGIQLADLCAHPIKTYVEHGNYLFYETVVKLKLHSNAKDRRTEKTVYMGNKVCLNR